MSPASRSRSARSGTFILLFSPSLFPLLKSLVLLFCPFRRSLTLEEKRSYIDAVKCLKSTPPKPNLFDGVRSLFDQFQARLSFLSLCRRILQTLTVIFFCSLGRAHQSHAPSPCVLVVLRLVVHTLPSDDSNFLSPADWSGSFIPFHRYYVSQYEKSLEECGYSGGHPYWSWSMVRLLPP